MDSFSDCVFAFAITLLVFDVTVPRWSQDLLAAILQQWPIYLAYIVTFSTIGAIWLAHTAITDHLAATDSVEMRINILLLLVVSFLPFPTRLLAAYIGETGQERVAVTIYGVSLLLASLLLSALWRYSVRAGLVDPHAGDDDIELITKRLTPGLAGYAVLIALGLFLPTTAIVGYLVIAAYLMFPVGLLMGRRGSRAMDGEPDAPAST